MLRFSGVAMVFLIMLPFILFLLFLLIRLSKTIDKPEETATLDLFGEEITLKKSALKRWEKKYKANKADPYSCEKEPLADEVSVPRSFFAPDSGIAGWEGWGKYSSEYSRSGLLGYHNIVMSKADYEDAVLYKANKKRRMELLNKYGNPEYLKYL